MNICLIISALILLCFTVLGYYRGFVRMLVGLVAWIIVFVLVNILAPYVTAFMKNDSGLYEAIQSGVANSDLDVMQTLKIVGLNETAGNLVADKTIQIIAMVATVVFVALVVHGITFALHLVSKLPLLEGVNRIVGAVVGFGEGVLIVWIVYLILVICSGTAWGGAGLRQIAGNPLLTLLFVKNPLLFLAG